ncbi:adenosylmethionine--8-amino-7-oxononanoate transaminase [Limimaricola pyoseonensis]|uniref:Adenosylmethionine-8-amino-7-oxononanoate aminotransferase n=1 Tax=Limimaricola pyoseonensis TaxID=521013 RepID=A0A1G6ZNX3_9RHOB|nr:adenosylmethionine--8-amino-7-oxononanoate transaminase [Limimaricola pyoseonensis]SDE04378.1 adenosylmethionine-8-amino-7-oxononanoate aminotransferase [Limimaricola pyoseonensis]
MTDAAEFDRDHLWHPYTNVTKPGPTFMVDRADGAWITLDDGTRMIDAMSSWWCTIHGHRHPAITAAMKDQIDRLPHVMFGGLTHEPAVELGRRLVAMTPAGLDRVFYCDSGSVAIEVAMKMAVQHQLAAGFPGRSRFATIRGGYHGDTWKAMSVCDPVNGMHHLFEGSLNIQYFAPRPPVTLDEGWPEDDEANGTAALLRLLHEHGDQIAALVLEPVVQGAGGMRFYHPEYLRRARRLCDEMGILLIFDEIATGFGRTGHLFAADLAGVTPDIMCLGKALTGGHISFASVMASSHVAETIGGGDPGLFMHGPTFMGNPLACAAACASLDLLADGTWRGRVAEIAAQMQAELAPARDLPGVADVRVLGAIAVIEMDHSVSADEAHPISRETGVWLRPFGRNIYAMPPFILAPDEVSRVSAAMLRLARTL